MSQTSHRGRPAKEIVNAFSKAIGSALKPMLLCTPSSLTITFTVVFWNTAFKCVYLFSPSFSRRLRFWGWSHGSAVKGYECSSKRPKTTSNSSSRGPKASSDLHRYLPTHMCHEHIHMHNRFSVIMGTGVNWFSETMKYIPSLQCCQSIA